MFLITVASLRMSVRPTCPPRGNSGKPLNEISVHDYRLTLLLVLYLLYNTCGGVFDGCAYCEQPSRERNTVWASSIAYKGQRMANCAGRMCQYEPMDQKIVMPKGQHARF